MEREEKIGTARMTAIMVTLLVAAFVTAMSTTVTGNMIPNFIDYFGVTSSLAQWLTSGATLISGVTVPVTAFLIKRVPNRTYFLAAMLFFTLGSLGAYMAESFAFLLVCRLIQAIGCGMLLSFAQIVLLALYPPESHGTIMAAYAMAATVSSVVGPTYAGLLLDHVGWRGVFASLFAIGLLVLISGALFMQNVTPRQDASLNLGFVALSSLGFAALLIGLNNVHAGIARPESGGLMALGVLLLACFSWLQLRSDSPMLNLRVFRHRTFLIAILLSVCLYLVALGNAMILPIFAKSIRGYSDTSYGLATVVGAVIGVISTLFAGRIYDRKGIAPMAVTGVGLLAIFSALGFFFSDATGIVTIGIAYALQNVSMSILNSPATAMALSGLKGQERVDGSALFNTLRQISSSLGSTVSVLIFTMTGAGLGSMRYVYSYFGLITVAVALLVTLHVRREGR